MNPYRKRAPRFVHFPVHIICSRIPQRLESWLVRLVRRAWFGRWV